MPTAFHRLDLPEVVLVEPTFFLDARGYLGETYRRSEFHAAGIHTEFVQDNHVHSGPRVLRGLHYQLPPAAQAKLVRVTRGAIFDVAVDVRRGSASFGRWVGARLGADDHRMLYIPEGFAHGYYVLTSEADVHYKVSAEYAPEQERGLRWDSAEIGITWPGPDPVLSDKDLVLPALSEADVFEDSASRASAADTASGEPA